MEFSELFTQSARDVMPHARRKGLVAYFDCRGPRLELHDPGPYLRAGIHRILLGIVDCFESGFVMFSAEVTPPVFGRSSIVIHAAGTGTSRTTDVVSVLQRLQLIPESVALDQGLVPHAEGPCPATGGTVQFVDAGHDGLVISLSGEVAATDPPFEHTPDAAGTAAWLVSTLPGALESVEMRLRQLGWHVTSFERLAAAADALAAGPAPMLMIVAEHVGDELPLLEQMVQAWPSLWAVLAVVSGSDTLRQRRQCPVDIRVLPLSPLELERFTAHVDTRTSTALSRLTSPSPLYVQESRRVLVVDDNVVNQIVARGQLEALGYEVVVAGDGIEALDSCCDAPPDMVLMDVDMPLMDGLEASEHLRSLQRVGTLPPFPIVAATAGDTELRRNACLSAGMDGYLSKPMDLQTLAEELHRVLPGRPVSMEA
ncbi:MAG: response regulator [Burkholderiales bacterium]|nr:response regulator [Burkholderiales bacterium]